MREVMLRINVTRGGYGWSGNLEILSSSNVGEESLKLIREIWLTLDKDCNKEELLITDEDLSIKIHGHVLCRDKKEARDIAARLGTSFSYHDCLYWVEADPRTILKV